MTAEDLGLVLGWAAFSVPTALAAVDVWHQGRSSMWAEVLSRQNRGAMALLRASAIAGVMPWLFLVSFILLGSFSTGTSGTNGLGVPTWVGVAGMSLIFAPAVLAATVVAFNRPRVLVPPAFRHERGLVGRQRTVRSESSNGDERAVDPGLPTVERSRAARHRHVGFRRRDRIASVLAFAGFGVLCWTIGTSAGELHDTERGAATAFYVSAGIVALAVAVHYHRGVSRFRRSGRAESPSVPRGWLALGLMLIVGFATPIPGPQLAWGSSLGVALASVYLIFYMPGREAAQRKLAQAESAKSRSGSEL